MQCPRCQHENSPEAKFCEACGTPLARLNQGGLPAASYADLKREVEHLTRALSESLEQQTATSEILRVISSSPTDVQPVFDRIVPNAVNLCGARMGAVYRFDGEMLHLAAHHNYPPAVLEVLQQMHPRPPQPDQASGRAILTRAIAQIEDMLTDPVYPREVAISGGWRSIIGVPMLRDGTPIGAIVIARGEAGAFSDSHVDLLKTFADQAVIAIENVRLFKELEEKNQALTQSHAQVSESLEQQTATSEILRVIASSPTDVQPVLEAVAESAARLCEAPDVSIFVQEADHLRVAARHGPIPSDTALPLSRESGVGWAVLAGRTVHVADMQTEVDRFPVSVQNARRLGFRTALNVPLIRKGVAIGAISLRRGEAHLFAERQVALLETFADQAVIAIENVRLFTELEARNRDLTELLGQQTATAQILRVISSSPTDVQPVFDTIVRSALRLCNGATTAVFRVDGGMLHHSANYGGSPEALAAARARYPRPVGKDSIPGIAILTRSDYEVPDTEDPSAVEMSRETGRILGIRSLLAVPVLRDAEAVGAIVVTRREPGRFAAPEVSLLKTFADQAVIAIENVRLFTELEARNRDLTVALEQQTATSEMLKVISRSVFDLQPVFDTMAENAVRLCEAERAFIFRFDGQLLRAVASYNAGPEVKEFVYRNPVAPGRHSISARAALERQTVHIPDVQAEPDYAYAVRDVDLIRTMLAVPMLKDEALVGTITIYRLEVRPFTDKQVLFRSASRAA